MKQDSIVAHGTTFLVTDQDAHTSRTYDGLYHDDTRHLDTYDVDTDTLALETLDVVPSRPGERVVHAASTMEVGSRRLSVRRRQIATEGLYERIEVSNLSRRPLSTRLEIDVHADFADIFEVRGHQPDRERQIDATTTNRGVRFDYRPTDVDFSRSTTVTVGTAATVDVTERGARLSVPLSLDPHESVTVPVAVVPDAAPSDVAEAVDRAHRRIERRAETWCEEVQPPQVTDQSRQAVLEQSVEDLLALSIETDHGPVLAAGLPWFATAFGRDSLIAAYQALPVAPQLAEGTLRYLAAHQATESDEFRAAEPGKILHEIRHGELAARGAVPHTPYYGTIDATALWVVLLHETWAQSGDDVLLDDLAPSLDAALEWLDTYADKDGDGFLEYPADRGDADGLTHQAWKDSGDGIMGPTGVHPEGPLAVAEVQGYHYDAKRRAAELFRARDEADRASELEREASDLAERFDDRFWLPDEEFYAVALDGSNDPVPTVTSNPGHCLWSGLVPSERADAVVDRLVADDMFSGWGIRTLSTTHDVYNPQSYHLGSVWPHDTSLIALGMANYGRHDAATAVADGLFDAAVARGTDRLPELFAGFDRETTSVPIQYGVACEPQAWAAGAPLLCLEATRGGRESTKRLAVSEQLG